MKRGCILTRFGNPNGFGNRKGALSLYALTVLWNWDIFPLLDGDATTTMSDRAASIVRLPNGGSYVPRKKKQHELNIKLLRKKQLFTANCSWKERKNINQT